MNSINRFLIGFLVVLLLVGSLGSVLAASSDEGNGTIDEVEDDSVDEDDEAIVVSDDSDDSSSSSGSVHASLSTHATANPLVLLLCALALIGLSKRI